MEKRDKEMPYEVIIQERNKVDLYGNVVYYICLLYTSDAADD